MVTVQTSDRIPKSPLTLLQNGDSLDAEEFLRRYERMPEVKKAELLGGIVFLSSPVRITQHGEPDQLLQTWIGVYAAHTPGVRGASNSTVKLNPQDVPQPDSLLRILSECGGQSHVDDRGYLLGSPELVVEIAASSASMDLHTKFAAYRRSGIREYLVWRTEDEIVEWWSLSASDLTALPVSKDGIVRSIHFPGLWLDLNALLKGDGSALLATLHRGLASEEHESFCQKLQGKAAKRPDH